MKHQQLRAFIADQFPNMGGWCDQEKAAAIGNLILDNNHKVIADVGVFEGKSTLALAHACKLNGAGLVYAVDSWCKPDCCVDEEKANRDWWSSIDIEGAYEGFLRHVVRAEVGRYINICRMQSYRAAMLLPDLDMVHIDANHAEWPSTSDVCLWLPKVKIGGHVVMDDVNWASTQTAVRFVKKFCKLIVEMPLAESHFAIYQRTK